MNNILKVLQIVNNNKKILLLTTLFIFSSIIDLIGLGLLIPYVNLILNPINIYNKFPFLENLSFFSENIILNLSILILLIFCSKFIFSLLINYLIYQNSQKLIHKLRMQLMNSFQ